MQSRIDNSCQAKYVILIVRLIVRVSFTLTYLILERYLFGVLGSL